MNKILKNSLITGLVLAILLVFCIPQAVFAQIPNYSDAYEQISIKVNGKDVSDVAFTCKGNIYVKTSTLSKYGDMSKLKINTSDKKITFKASSLDINLGNSEVTAFVKENAGECFIPLKYFDDENGKDDYFVSLGPVAQLAKLAYTFSNNTLILSQYSKSSTLATVQIDTAAVASLQNKSIASLSTGETVFIIKESNSFYKVESLDGNQYYVNKTEVNKVDDVSKVCDFQYIPTAKDVFNKQINLAWVLLAENAVRTPLPPEDTSGIDVLSPIWLHSPANADGYVRHLCDYGYVQLAHSMGYKVWMCANNCFTETGTTKYTTQLLASEKLSNRVIAQYLLYACMYNVDGINLDYETLTNADKANFTAFNQKLNSYCQKLGLTYSIAVYPYNQSNGNKYDFAKLGECSDYLAPMMYANTTSNVNPQSISSYEWYSNSVNKLLEVVPAEKVLLGTPLFTRYWYVNDNGQVIDKANYKKYTGTIGLNTIEEKLQTKAYNMHWDDHTKQYVLSYQSDSGSLVKMWYEEERSMATRLQYVQQKGLAGIASWALGEEDSTILTVIDQILDQGVDPQSILDKYQ